MTNEQRDAMIGMAVVASAVALVVLLGWLVFVLPDWGDVEECSREAAIVAIERDGRWASVERVERGDYDDLLREACYGR